MYPNNSETRLAPPTAPPATVMQPPLSPPPMPFPPLPMPFPPSHPYISKPGQWSTGLCGCCEDPSNCIITCFCPCITFGQNVEIIDKGTTTCIAAGLIYYILLHTFCPCLYTCTYRTKLRSLYGLQEDPCADCFVHCCCNCCAICQEYRELKNHGFDPSIGWLPNVERMNRVGTLVPPAVAQRMSR